MLSLVFIPSVSNWIYIQAFISLIINAWFISLNSSLLPQGSCCLPLLSTSLYLFTIPERLEDVWHTNSLVSIKINQSAFKIHFIPAIPILFSEHRLKTYGSIVCICKSLRKNFPPYYLWIQSLIYFNIHLNGAFIDSEISKVQQEQKCQSKSSIPLLHHPPHAVQISQVSSVLPTSNDRQNGDVLPTMFQLNLQFRTIPSSPAWKIDWQQL